jgi:hypothetical protein
MTDKTEENKETNRILPFAAMFIANPTDITTLQHKSPMKTRAQTHTYFTFCTHVMHITSNDQLNIAIMAGGKHIAHLITMHPTNISLIPL